MKQRIVIRLHLAVRAVLQSEADWRGTRLGTLTSELIHEQAAKARLCGVQNYELNPVSSRYVPVTNGTKYKQTSGLEQISIYLNDEDMQTLKELALANDSVRVINGRQAITYRYVVPGMLLNDPVFTGLTEQNSTAGKHFKILNKSKAAPRFLKDAVRFVCKAA